MKSRPTDSRSACWTKWDEKQFAKVCAIFIVAGFYRISMIITITIINIIPQIHFWKGILRDNSIFIIFISVLCSCAYKHNDNFCAKPTFAKRYCLILLPPTITPKPEHCCAACDRIKHNVLWNIRVQVFIFWTERWKTEGEYQETCWQWYVLLVAYLWV